ncbi:MAG: flippase [Elusimicrobiota bacterium]
MDIHKVFKNTFAIGFSQIINKIILFVLTIFIARYLKEIGFGQYSLVLTLVGFFNLFTNFGLSTIALREVSKNYTSANRYFNNIFFLRIILGLLSYIFLFVSVKLLKYKPEIITATCIYGLTLFTNNIIDLVSYIFNAFEKMEYLAALTVSLNLLTLVLSIYILRIDYGLLGLVTVSVIAGFIVVFLGFFISRRHLYLDFKELNFGFAKGLIKNSTSLMLLGFIGLVYFRIDIVLLSKLKGIYEVGVYNVAYKLMDTFMIVSNSVVGATFPYMARYFHSSIKDFKKLINKLLLVLIFLGLIIATTISIFSKEIIFLFFGPAFVSSIPALKILIWTIPLIYINAVLVYTLIAANQQSQIIIVTGIVTIVNFLLNILLIPKYSYIGSSYITIISEFFVLLGYCYLVKNRVFLKHYE